MREGPPRRLRRPPLTPKPTPTLRPVVLIAGGTGTVNAPTGESPAVLDTAQIYDPTAGKFVLAKPMTAHRDRHAAAILPDGKVLIVGGVDTVLVPLVSFPGPAMPWILSSAEILNSRDGHFSTTARMITPRDEPTATLQGTAKCWSWEAVTASRNCMIQKNIPSPRLARWPRAAMDKPRRYCAMARF